MRTPVPSKRLLIRMAWIVGIATLILIVYLLLLVLNLSSEVDSTQREVDESADARDDMSEVIGTQQYAIDKLIRRCRATNGCKPIELPDEITEPADVPEVIEGEPGKDGIDGKDGARGAPGPSCIEEIGREACRGDQGSTGSTGQAGSDGTDGEDGATGATGATGEPGKDGAPGKDGVDGKDGAPGRGIADLQCGDDGRWTVTYTDGTTADAGVCRAPLIPDPQQ